MKKIIVLISIFIFSQNIFAQSGWQRIADFVSYNFDIVEYPGSDTVYVGGIYIDFILKSTDKGNTWQKKSNVNLGRYMHDYMKFFDSRNGIFNTAEGVLKTTDGGESYSWIYQNNHILGISFINMNTGYIQLTGSQNLLKTTNSGNNWTTVYQNFPYFQLYFINESTGFANDNTFYKTLRTTDSGVTWNAVLDENTVDDLKLIGNNVYLISSNVLFKSTNFGLNFSPFYTSTNNLQHIIALNNNSFILSTYDSLLIKTTNSGANWISYSSHHKASLNANFNSEGYGVSANSEGKIYTINPDLTTITDIYKDQIQIISDLSIADENNLYIIGEPNTLAKSTDGGMSFIKNYINFTPSSISFLNVNTGYVTSQNKILKTTDKGINWGVVFQNPNTSSYFPDKIHIINNVYGYYWRNYIYNAETLYVSTDGSASWIQSNLNGYRYPTGISTYTYKSIFDLAISSNGIGYCGLRYSDAPNLNKILKTTNYGVYWFNATGNLNVQNIAFLNFINSDTGFAVTNRTFLYRTVDGGNNWIQTGSIQNVNPVGASDIKFINANTGFCLYYVYGTPDAMFISKTTNAGQTWRETNLNADDISIYNIQFINEQVGFLYGGPTAQMYKTTDGGFVFVKQISSEIPEKFSLSQNYPNPFNPSTKINYEIKLSGFVSLKVFDMLGNEVAQLVNEKQNAGSYAVDFNSAEFNLPSGIYFYTLNAGEFKETKKMVLVK